QGRGEGPAGAGTPAIPVVVGQTGEGLANGQVGEGLGPDQRSLEVGSVRGVVWLGEVRGEDAAPAPAATPPAGRWGGRRHRRRDLDNVDLFAAGGTGLEGARSGGEIGRERAAGGVE